MGSFSGKAHRIGIGCMLWGATTLLICPPAFAQELEARRWNHIPIDQNFANVTYAHSDGDISFDPVLGISDASTDLDTLAAGYVRSFALLGKLARVEVRQPWQRGEWTGLVNGAPASVERDGLADTVVRVAVNIVGSPPLSGKEFAAYRAANPIETIVGVGLSVQLPTGEYFDDRLINLGTNRFMFRPQIGVQHQRRNWTFEITGTASIYTDNNSFLSTNQLTQKPFYTLDGSVIYSFNSGVWTSASAGVGIGGRTAVNGVSHDDRREDFGWQLSAGMPLTRSFAIKASYTGFDRWKFIGNDSRTISVGLLASWQ